MGQFERPILLNLKGLISPISLARKMLGETREIMNTEQYSEIVVHGLFILIMSRFEVMITDILLYYLKWMPNKLDFREAKFSKNELLNDELVQLQIEKSINSLSYKRIDEVLEEFFTILSIDFTYKDLFLDRLIEMKETRNLLLHNNLVVNRVYLEKAGKLKRTTYLSSKLNLDKAYLINAINLLDDFISRIEDGIKVKYSNYTKIAALRRLWEYLFKSPILKFDDYWIIDEVSDSVMALKKCEYEDGLSSSERMFLGMWRAHFNGHGEYLKNFNMKGLSSERKSQMIFFLSIAGDLSFE